MIKYSGYEYMCIDIANQYGLDKELFETRIQWTQDHLSELEGLSDKAECQPLYKKAVMALRKAQKGIATGHLVAVDAVCSGVQLMSVLTGCIAGATSTGLVNPNERADAYSKLTEVMEGILGGKVHISRADAKQALMTTMYGSKAEPKKLFGEDTPEIDAFYSAANKIAPGAWELLQDLLASWKPYALIHEWKLPDGFDAKVKVMTKQEVRIEIDELDHATMGYEFYENVGQKSGLSNVANVVHSVDAYVLRCIHRRCNYDHDAVSVASLLLESEMLRRMLGGQQEAEYIDLTGKASYYIEQYERSGMADVVILPYLDTLTITALSYKHLQKLVEIVNGMLEYKPFEVITIHDSFAAHANNVNHVRQQYINVLADMAESNLLDDLLSQLYGKPGKFNKLSTNLGTLIRNSNYALS